MAKDKETDAIFSLHDEGSTVTEIAQSLRLDAAYVRRAMIRHWDKTGRSEALAQKVATRRGPTT